MAGRDQRRSRGRWHWLASHLRPVIVPWVVSRFVVLLALAVARELAARTTLPADVAGRIHQGLLGWDVGWYESIATRGYWGAGHESLRFFPLFPVIGRAVSALPGVSIGAALVFIANASALVALCVLYALARHETHDDAIARRAAWFAALAPPAFVFVMGYAEGTFVALAAGTMLMLRRRMWWWAALLGALAALTRPIGVLLFVPAAVEAVRSIASARTRERVGRAAAVLSPAVACGAFLAWVGWRYGDALAPLRIQEESGHRGAVADPFVTLAHDARLLASGHHLGEALHLPWVLLALALTVVCFRRWPASYGAFAAAVLAVSLTASNLDSFERYALSAFPLVLAAASITSRPVVERTVLVAASAGLVGYALLAFLNLYVP